MGTKTKELRLPLTRQWFEMTKSGVKKEDYREITPYWCARLLLTDGFSLKRKAWEKFLLKLGFDDFIKFIKGELNVALFRNGKFEFEHFDKNTMTLGYPKSTATERIIKLEHKGIEIGCGKPEWGAEPDKLYFVIKHGRTFND